MLNYTNFYMLRVFVMTLYLRIRHKIEGIEGNRPLRVGEIRRNPATIALAKFFSYVIVGSIGFQQVAVLAIGSVGKGAVDNQRLRIFWVFFFSNF